MASTCRRAIWTKPSIDKTSLKICAFEICQSNLLSVSALKHFTKGPINSSFCKSPCAKKNKYGNISSEEIAQSIVKIYWLQESSLTGQFPDWHFPKERPPTDTSPMNTSPTDTSPTGLFPDKTFPRRRFPRPDISPIIMY